MTEMTKYEPGVFCWVDHAAHDLEAAERWYAELFGWEIARQDTGGGPPYSMLLKDGKHVAGMGQMNDPMKSAGVPPMWNDYIAVDDVEAVAKRVEAAGGKVMVPPMKVMDAGWLAFFTDPGGASFGVWQAGEHHGAQLVNEPGAFSWNELSTRDVPGSRAFYEQVFGWGFTEQDMGSFQYTVIKAGDRDNGGIMPMHGPMWEGIPPHWMTYFTVEDCDAAAKKVEQTGGKVMVPPNDIPPGRFAVVQDPQGGIFTVIKLNAPA
ncbi:MAG: VOC family protein [Myxococcales bacterium]|nr:VOC family protein [Myxococcales bacterium]